jgi:RNA polymerase sigma factor (sigma-70 family)
MALTLSMASIVPACSEQELLEAARGGDDRAFEELYSRYRERISAFILGRVHDHGRAEDIAQEVFMSALRRLRVSEHAIAFKPWIYEIAKNACIDEFRRSQRAREVSLDADEEFAGGQRALHSISPTPPAAMESKQRFDDLRSALGGLSDNHHQLLVMREFEGLSYDEIGARTGMSRQMVESALFRARRKLTEEYDELASGRRCQQVQCAIDDGRVQSLRSFGIRERRQLTRHLAHCQPCRVKAHLAGVDEALVRPRSIAAKIAALLPFPLWRWPWRGGGGAKTAVARTGSHHVTVQSLQGAAAAAEPAAATTTFGAAAVAAAAIAIAGGGIVSGLSSHGHPTRAPAAATARARATGAGLAPATSPAAEAARAGRLRSRAAGSQSASSRRGQSLTHFRSVSAAGPSAGVATSPTKGGTSGPPTTAPSPTGRPPAPTLAPTLPTGTVSGTTGKALSGVTKTTLATVHHVLPTVDHVLPTGSGAPTLSGKIGITTPGGSTPAPPTSTLKATAKQLGTTVSATASGILP